MTPKYIACERLLYRIGVTIAGLGSGLFLPAPTTFTKPNLFSLCIRCLSHYSKINTIFSSHLLNWAGKVGVCKKTKTFLLLRISDGEYGGAEGGG